ncbi:hypothetical protein COU15_00100 [Candidatus Kaiserbacteria bacterium CG10_big_fil_rev_8_21_14_0_10_45_20]|uniref:PDZ domain-containing protein n=1 Tax=Candidatus Kaiserbacteria bacterium CG10_big_fil_rev_8_21_14_0_10_45_20 TaxID=1974607 RepID=A0A2H0UGD8_9BACT|nr:MAG: hypothetical protein COU15_00100 [Candidatus Kaiserbacteria bacterium CG10_big_fil_rev_8_21_14_0_10_45_20]
MNEPEVKNAEAKSKNDYKKIGIISAIVFIVGVIAGSTGILPFAGANTDVGKIPENADFDALHRAWNILEQNYVSASSTQPDVSPEERVWGAISGLASSYGDPYTTFFPPEEKKSFESEVRGDFEGVGMEIGLRDDVLVVIAPLKNTPAYRAGIESGDVILLIDGKSTQGFTTEEAVRLIRGPKGSTVVLTVSRDGGAPFEIPIVRDTILLPTIDTTLRDDGVFVLSLYSFNALAPQYFRGAIQEFANSGSTKLLIDLRGNPGGFLEVAIELSSWFLPVGKVVVSEDHGEGASAHVVHRSRGYDVFNDVVDVAILINQGSASASEIFAGALQQHGEATLIGSSSFGKGSVQQLFPVTDDTSLKITIAQWLTPNGKSISDGGLTPDIEVEVTDEDRAAERDVQLERAVEFLLNGE